jgi:NAD(P)-dependent dehydrogenase (short-subunit alcohol dehydrogenase family)
MNSVALVTGANKGIGFEIARQLGVRGMSIIVAARGSQRGAVAAARLADQGVDARSVVLDVTNQGTIEAAAREIEAAPGRLDVLVNNAGIQIDGTAKPSEVSLDTLRHTYETNVFGPVAVTQAFLPLLRRSPAGRIVNISTGLGSLTQNSDPDYEFFPVKHLAYNSSKTALNSVTVQFAYELRDTLIKVNAADPGYTATDFNNHKGTRTVQQAAAIAVRLATLEDDAPTGGFFNDAGPLPW